MLKYRPEIDGLRAIAVVSVIFFHAKIAAFSGGFVGVDVFFVISGYLITSIILNDCRAGRFTILGFYDRRVRRIIPALLLVTLTCLPFGWFWMNPERLTLLGQSAISVFAFVSNIFFWRGAGYFSETGAVNPLLHTWSLAIEEQFYIAFPPLLVLLSRLKPQATSLVLLVAGALSFALGLWLTREAPSAAFFLAPSRTWELLAGALLAVQLDGRDPAVGRVAGTVGALAGLAMIAGSIFLFDRGTPFPGVAAALPVAGTVLLILFARPSNAVGRLLSCKPVVGLGLISYSAYLWHQPVFAFAQIRGIAFDSSVGLALLLGLVLALSYLSWRFVETPFRDRRRVNSVHVRRLFLATVYTAVLVGAFTLAGDGFRGRYPSDVQALAARVEYSPLRAGCHTSDNGGPSPREACVLFNGKLRWAVLGDSHAVEIAYALAERISGHGEALLQLSHSDCPPAYGFPEAYGCHEWTRDAVDRLIAAKTIDTVVVTYRHTGYMFGDVADTYPEMPNAIHYNTELTDPAKARNVYWSSFLQMLEALRAAGKRVIVTYPIPELSANIAATIYPKSILDDTSAARNAPGMSLAEFRRLNAFVLGRLDHIPWSDRLLRIRPSRVICQGKTCPAIRDGIPYYFDAHHLTLSAAELVAAQIDRAVRRADD